MTLRGAQMAAIGGHPVILLGQYVNPARAQLAARADRARALARVEALCDALRAAPETLAVLDCGRAWGDHLAHCGESVAAILAAALAAETGPQ